MIDRLKVLLIENSPEDARLVEEALSDSQQCGEYELVVVNRLSKGVKFLAENQVAAVLLDLALPDSRGLKTFHTLYKKESKVPIILLTGDDDESLAHMAVREGAQDYLVKGKVNGDLLIRTIQYALGRKQAGETIRETEEQYRLLTENMIDTVWILDTDTMRFRYVSPSVERLLGFSVEKILAAPIELTFTAERKDFLRALILERAQDFIAGRVLRDKYYRNEVEQVCKNGSTVWTEAIVRYYLNEKTGHVELHGVSRDITERRRMEQAGLIITEAQRQIARLDQLQDVYQLVGATVHKIIGDGYVSISSIDEKNQSGRTVGVFGLGPEYETLLKRINFDPSKFVFYLKDMTEAEIRLFRSGRLEEYPQGLYALLTRKLPKSVCSSVERELKITGVYVIGFLLNEVHSGGLSILAKNNISPFRTMIETIVSQAAVSIKRIMAEKTLRENEERFRTVFENASIGMYRTGPNGSFRLANPAFLRMVGCESFEELPGYDPEKDCFTPDIFTPDISRKEFHALLKKEGEINGLETHWRRKDGTNVFVRESAKIIRDDQGEVLYYEGTTEDISERKLALTALDESEDRYRNLFENSPISLWEEDFSAVKQYIDEMKHQGISDFNSYFDSHPEEVAGCVARIKVLDVNKATLKIMKAGTKDELLQPLLSQYRPELFRGFASEFVSIAEGRTDFDWEGANFAMDGEKLLVRLRLSVAPGFEQSLSNVIITMVDITKSKQAEEALKQQSEELRRRNEELARLYRATGALIESTTYDLRALANTIVEVVFEEFGQANCSVFLVQNDSNILDRIAVGGLYASQVSKIQLTLDGPGQVPLAIRSGQLINTPDVRLVPSYVPSWDAARSELTIPLKVGGRCIGAIDVQSSESNVFGSNDERLISIFAERAAMVSEHAALYIQTERRLQNLTSLRTIDMAIASSSDLRFTLGILLDQVTKQLNIHATDVLVFNPLTQMLRYMNGLGFRTRALQYTNLRLSDGYAGRAARERRIVTIKNLDKNPGGLERSSELNREGFISYVGVPLIAKGQIKGVLEIFNRDLLDLDQEKIAFLEMLAGQAAIAIDNSELFENLQSSNAELLMAYDETIEGWSHAMDLRDEETEGHSQRVCEMTLRLASSMAFGTAELVHIRRGALLHDIGKIGVPDEILHKPGKLDEDEWIIMRKHPQFANDMISPILYLRKALDIPYCHHEKWDGTGYPRGLKGEQIPLAARIFAVVDVWDALTSDRPYRKAWSEEQARDYLIEQTGKHFDPRVVDVFLRELLNRGS
jgi:PAS domain S-box-containing protein